MALNKMFDQEGFLRDINNWTKELAIQIASQEQITLLEPHWELIYLAREYQVNFEKSPEMRPFINYIKKNLNKEKASSIYLLSLFPNSPAKLISKIAGLPKPDNCL